jgi:single-stranded DNA-binding protein
MNNQITLVGRVGQTPEPKVFPKSGNKVVHFDIGVKEFSANNDGGTMWIDVESWNELADRVLATITKGREIVACGRLSVTNYAKEIDGQLVKISKPVIKLTSFHLCGRKPTKGEETTYVDPRVMNA